MTQELVYLSLLSGFIYIIAPGPVFLNLTGVVAHKGLRAGFELISGSLIGDILWIAFAMYSLFFSYFFDPKLFMALGLLCGAYLLYLGVKALISKSELTKDCVLNPSHPFRRGLVLGTLNPKSYPVLLATLTALIGAKLAGGKAGIVLEALILVVVGAVAADIIFVLVCAMPFIKKAFLRYSFLIVKIVGAIFLFFGGDIFIHSCRQIWALL